MRRTCRRIRRRTRCQACGSLPRSASSAAARSTAWCSRCAAILIGCRPRRSEEHTSELQSHSDLVCRLLLEKKKKKKNKPTQQKESVQKKNRVDVDLHVKIDS